MIRAKSINTVLFDLDDTIFAHAEAVRQGVHAHRLTHGGAMAEADEAQEFARWHALEEEHNVRYLSGELSFLAQRRERVRHFVEPWGLDLADDAAADEWFGRYLGEYRKGWRLHDDALPCFEALAASIPGVRFGIITNGDIEFQTDKLRGVEATHLFDHVIASGEVGVAKPDARIFEIAAQTFGVELAECAYIGDRLETDAIGAAAAGMTGVWIDRAGIATGEELERAAAAGAVVIRGLDELPALLG